MKTSDTTLKKRSPGVLIEYIRKTKGAGIIQYASPDFKNVFHLDPGNTPFDAARLFDMLSPSDASRIIKAIEVAATNLTTFDQEYQILLPDGTKRRHRAIAKFNLHADGNAHAFAAIQDITTIREATKENTTRNYVLEKLIRNMPGSVLYEITLDRKGKSQLNYISDNCTAILGHNKEEFSNNPELLYTIIHKDDQSRFRKEREAALKSGEELDIDLRLGGKQLFPRWINLRSAKYRTKEESGRYGIITDITSRKYELDKITKEGQLFKSMFEAHDAIMLLIDPKTGNILNANHAASKFYGYSHKEFSRMNISELNTLPPIQLANEWKKALSQKTNFFQFIHRNKKGEFRNVEVHSSPIEISGKKILFSIIHDITKQVLNEMELSKYWERLTMLANNLPDTIIFSSIETTNHQFQVEYISDNCKEILGLKKESIIRNPVIMVNRIRPEAKPAYMAKRTAALAAGLPYEHEFEFRTGKNKWIWLQLKAHPAILPDGRTCWNSLVSNVTLRKKQETEIYEKDRIFKELFNSSVTPMLLMDADKGNIIDANPATQSLYKYPLAALQKLNIRDLNKKASKAASAKVRNLINNGTKSSFSFQHYTSDKELLEVDINATPIRLNRRKYIFVTIHDQTEKNTRLQTERKTAREKQSRILQSFNQQIHQEKFKVGYTLNEEINQLLAGAQILMDPSDPWTLLTPEQMKAREALNQAIGMIRDLGMALNPDISLFSLPEIINNLAGRFKKTTLNNLQVLQNGHTSFTVSNSVKQLIYQVIEDFLSWASKETSNAHITIKFNTTQSTVTVSFVLRLTEKQKQSLNDFIIEPADSQLAFYQGKMKETKSGGNMNSYVIQVPCFPVERDI